MIPRRALLVLFAILGTACQAAQPTRTCDEVSASVLHGIIQRPGSPEEVRAQIASGYVLPLEQVLVTSNRGATLFEWSKDDVAFSMGTGGVNRLSGGSYYHSRPPSIATVMGCLGTPDYYRAYYQMGGEAPQNLLELDLYFTRQGVVATAYKRASGQAPPKLSTDFPMQAFGFVPVLSPEDTLAQLNQNQSTQFRQQIKPWPGKLEGVVIDIDPDLTR